MRNFETKYYIDGVETEYKEWDRLWWKEYCNYRYDMIHKVCKKLNVIDYKVYQAERYEMAYDGCAFLILTTNEEINHKLYWELETLDSDTPFTIRIREELPFKEDTFELIYDSQIEQNSKEN